MKARHLQLVYILTIYLWSKQEEISFLGTQMGFTQEETPDSVPGNEQFNLKDQFTLHQKGLLLRHFQNPRLLVYSPVYMTFFFFSLLVESLVAVHLELNKPRENSRLRKLKFIILSSGKQIKVRGLNKRVLSGETHAARISVKFCSALELSAHGCVSCRPQK